MALLFLVYPHAQYLRTRRLPDPTAGELRNLRTDSVFLGMGVATIGFPVWITFAGLLGTLSNNTANKGWTGIAETLVAFPGGALLGCLIWGFRFEPDTDWVTTLCCIIGLTLYLTALGQVAFTRILRLRVTREALQVRERELMEANDALHRNLREIDELQEQLREQANRDPLTGLYNRRYLDSTLERELARCKRDGNPWRSSSSTSITSSRSTTPTAIRPATKSCSGSQPCWPAWPGQGRGLPLRRRGIPAADADHAHGLRAGTCRSLAHRLRSA
jgi:hypothetical protein